MGLSFHSGLAKAHLETPEEEVRNLLIEEADRITGFGSPPSTFCRTHRWLYSRPSQALADDSLWDEDNGLGACGDWCGAPRVEGALRSGMSLAGKVLGTLHQQSSVNRNAGPPKQLSLLPESPLE